MSDTTSSLGSSLPSEVLDGIIQCFASRRCDNSGNWFYDSQDISVRMDKRQLAACSLVCRYWFQRCRPHIIGTLRLRSEQDVNDLLAMMRSLSTRRFAPGSPVLAMAKAMDELVAVQSGPWTKPWLHDVTSRVFFDSLLLRPFMSLRLVVEDAYIPESSSTEPSMKHAPSSLSTYLPRTLPGVFFQFRDIDLSDLRFRRPLDLFRMVNDVPTVYRVSLTRIAFTEGVDAPLPERIWRPHPNLVSVNIFDCGGYVFEVQVLFLFLLCRVRREGEALGMLLDAGPALQDVVASCTLSKEKVPMKITRRPYWIELTCYPDIEMPPTHHIQYSVDIVEDGSTVSISPASTTYETSFTLTLCSKVKLEDVKSWNWETIDDVLNTLHPRPSVEILTSDGNIFKWFLRGVREERLLNRCRRNGNLDVHSLRDDSSGDILCSLEDIYNAQAAYRFDGAEVKLDVCQRFDLWRCPDEEKEAFLRQLLANVNHLTSPNGSSTEDTKQR